MTRLEKSMETESGRRKLIEGKTKKQIIDLVIRLVRDEEFKYYEYYGRGKNIYKHKGKYMSWYRYQVPGLIKGQKINKQKWTSLSKLSIKELKLMVMTFAY